MLLVLLICLSETSVAIASSTFVLPAIGMIPIPPLTREVGECYLDPWAAVERWKKAAEQGDAEAQYRLGKFYMRSEYELEEAKKWFDLAIAQDNEWSWLSLAECYIGALGTEYNEFMAYEYYIKAAEAGNLEAMCEPYSMYLNGGLDYSELQKTEYWVVKAAESGYEDAQSLLGEIAARSVPFDDDESELFFFGFYEQDNDPSNGDEHIRWIKLAEEGNRLLLLSKSSLDVKPYNKPNNKVTWENCTLRSWLNGVFLHEAFSEEEKACLLSVTLDNLGEPATEDTVFLLSANEYLQYNPDCDQEGIEYSAYAQKKTSSNWASRWWCRAEAISYGERKIEANGLITLTYSPFNSALGVRPAVWIDREAYFSMNIKGWQNAGVQYHMGLTYLDNKAYEYALKAFQKAANMGNAEAQYQLGLLFINTDYMEPDYGQAIRALRKAGDMGSNNALYELGWCYREGLGVEQNAENAKSLFAKAAEAGNVNASYIMGILRLEEELSVTGHSADFTDAVSYFRQSAESGYIIAEYALGYCYFYGLGTEQDYRQAVQWFRKAAEAGQPFAIQAMAYCYENGIGVEKDQAQADNWYWQLEE